MMLTLKLERPGASEGKGLIKVTITYMLYDKSNYNSCATQINRYEFIEFNALNETYAGYIRIPKTINVLRLRPQ